MALAWLTHLRNRDFHDPQILWSQALRRNPQAFRANWWAAVDAARRGDVDRALDHAARSTRRMPNGLAFHEVARLFHEAGDLRALERTCRAGSATLDENRWSGKPTWFDLHAILAESLLARGAAPAAAAVCRSILPQARAALPEHHAITIGLRLTLLRCQLAEDPAMAVLQDRDGNVAAAETNLQEVVRLQIESAGTDADAGAALETLASFLTSHERHAETVPLWSEIWRIRGRCFGVDHPRSQAAGRQLVRALELAGRSAEAREVGALLQRAAHSTPAAQPRD